MAVPTFQDIMLPLLQILRDQHEHTHSEVIEQLAQHFALNEQDRRELLPSGKQSKFDNRVGWARTHLVKALLVESTGRGRYRITERGSKVLRDNPPEITMALLMQFPEFQHFRSRAQQHNHDTVPGASDQATSHTPDEMLQAAYQTMRDELEQALLDRVTRCSPAFFEQLVVDLLVAMGYGGSRTDAGQAIGRSGDGGIDGIIKEDRLGLDVIYIQAKRWNSTVGSPQVQAFAGALMGKKANKGILITTSEFSQQARVYVTNLQQKIILIDGRQLVTYMFDFNIGATEAETYVVKKVDLDYFIEE
jgi:restriction system protein